MKVRFATAVVVFLAVVLLSASACATSPATATATRPPTPSPTPVPTPTLTAIAAPTPTATSTPTHTPIASPTVSCAPYGADCEELARDAHTVVIGRVLEGSRHVIEPTRKQSGLRYSQWLVEVQSYPLRPLSYEHIIVRVFETLLLQLSDDPDPAKWVQQPLRDPDLDVGEHVVLFLGKRDTVESGLPVDPPLAENEFTFPFGLAGKLIVEDGTVRDTWGSTAGVGREPLEDFIARIKAAVR